jgi:hypothetical protein
MMRPLRKPWIQCTMKMFGPMLHLMTQYTTISGEARNSWFTFNGPTGTKFNIRTYFGAVWNIKVTKGWKKNDSALRCENKIYQLGALQADKCYSKAYAWEIMHGFWFFLINPVYCFSVVPLLRSFSSKIRSHHNRHVSVISVFLKWPPAQRPGIRPLLFL